jgi:hypothetical protein
MLFAVRFHDHPARLDVRRRELQKVAIFFWAKALPGHRALVQGASSALTPALSRRRKGAQDVPVARAPRQEYHVRSGERSTP